jgi:hypothetical protein
LASQPSHAQAQDYKADAAKAAEESGGSSSPMPFILIGGIVVVLGVGAFLIIRHRRKPTTPTATPTPSAVPSPSPSNDGSVLSGSPAWKREENVS